MKKRMALSHWKPSKKPLLIPKGEAGRRFGQAHLHTHLRDPFGTHLIAPHISSHLSITKTGIQARHSTIRHLLQSTNFFLISPKMPFLSPLSKRFFFKTPNSGLWLLFMGYLLGTAINCERLVAGSSSCNYCWVFCCFFLPREPFLPCFPVATLCCAFVWPPGTELFICTNSAGPAPRGLFVQWPVEPPWLYCWQVVGGIQVFVVKLFIDNYLLITTAASFL